MTDCSSSDTFSNFYTYLCNSFNNINEKATIVCAAFIGTFAKLLTMCCNLMSPKQNKPQRELDFLRQCELVGEKRIILLRHTETTWNNFVTGVKSLYRFNIPRWVSIWSHLYREFVYLPSNYSMFFDTVLTEQGVELVEQLHNFLFSNQPEQILTERRALDAVNILRGPHWHDYSKVNNNDRDGSDGVNDQEKEKQTGLKMRKDVNNGRIDQESHTTETMHVNPCGESLRSFEKTTQPAMLITSHLRRTILTLALSLKTRLLLHHQIKSNETQNNQQGDKNNQGKIKETRSILHEEIVINSLCKEMSINVDSVSLTPVGQVPLLSTPDCNNALINWSNHNIFQKDNNSNPISPEDSILLGERFIHNSCSLTHYESRGASTDISILDNFTKWIFSQKNDNFIVCGHSSWFRNFYRNFIAIPTPNSNVSKIQLERMKLVKDKRMNNSAVVSVVLKLSRAPNGDDIYWIDPDDIIPVWGTGHKT